MIRRILFVLAITAPAISHGAVYQCKTNGQTVFSDRPCGDDAKEIEVKAPASNGGGTMQSEAGDRFIQGRALDREIRDLEREKDAIRKKMDKAIADWQRQKRRANNNLAGATWEQSLAQEAEVMRKRYQSELDDVDRELERAKEQRANL